MAIKTKTSAGMKVAAIAVALIASQSAWAGDYFLYFGDNASTYTLSELTTGWWSNNQHNTAAEGAPGANSDVRLTGGTYLIGDGDELSYSYYEVGHGWGRYTTNNITGGSLTLTGNLAVGYWSDGHALLKMTGGAVSAGTILVPATDGNTACKDAHVVQEGGSITSRNDTKIGTLANDAADWTISGGSLSVGGELLIADASGSVDTLTVSGDATVAVTGALTVGSWGTGTLTMSGGEITVGGNTYIGRCGTAVGTFTLTGGTVTAQEVQIGVLENATGVLNLNGGTFAAKKFAGTSGTGTLNLNGGTLAASATDSVGLIPSTATVTVNVTANSVISNDVAATIGKAIDTGSYTLTKKGAGTLTFTAAPTGTLVIEEGAVSMASNLLSGVNISFGANGRLVVDARDVAVGDTFTIGGVTLPSGETDASKFILVSFGDRTRTATISGTTVTVATATDAESAIATYWTAAVNNTEWATAGNWSRGVPQDSDTAVFAVDSAIASFMGDTIATLRLENGATAQIGQFNSENQLTVSSGIEGTGTIVLRGCKLSVAENAEIPATISFRSDNPGTKPNWIIGKPVVNGDIELTHDTTRQLRINATLKGKMTGTGTAYIQGGSLLFGDNSEFEGTIYLAEKAVTICDPAAGAPKAVWQIGNETGINHTYAENFNNKTFKMGRMTGSNWFKVPSAITGMTIEVGERDDADMDYTGDFSSTTSTGGNESHEQTNINIVKVGSGVWHNKSAGYASLGVSNGTVRLYTNASNANRASIRKNFTVEVAEGAAIGGTIENSVGRTIMSLTFEDGAAYEVFTTTTTGDAPTTSVDNLTATAVNIEGDLVVKMSDAEAEKITTSPQSVVSASTLTGKSFNKQAVVGDDGKTQQMFVSDNTMGWFARTVNSAIQIFARSLKSGFVIIIQ